MTDPQAIAMIHDAQDPLLASSPAQWALGTLKSALADAGHTVSDDAEGADKTIHVVAGDKGRAMAEKVGLALPDAAEAYALFADHGHIHAWGQDERGLVYALTELADRVRLDAADVFGTDLPVVEAPANRIRSITRIFANEKEDKAWFHDKSFWIEYLTMLASNRFNRFSLTLGIQYDYPYHNNIISCVYLHFPYPYLVDLPNYPIAVKELPAAERETNLEMLKFIGREAARRGLDFQLGLWTQRYDFDDVPNANYTIVGATEETIAPYCRDAIALLLKEVPEITGLTFRIHVEGGVSEGDYDFWRTAFDGVKSAGRPIEIDMHAKGLDDETLAVARESGMPVSVSPKYLAEHVGLPYHTSAIREREYPPKHAMTNREKLSVGSRRFTRQSYGDFLSAGRDWRVTHRVWPGTQRVLAWGDPAMAAGYGRSGSFCDSDGLEWMEPLTFKGRQGSGVPGGRTVYQRHDLIEKYDWRKYLYQYRLWGRLSYNPDAGPGNWERYLAAECGDAAAACQTALSSASHILPLITHAHGPSIANNAYWPEIYTNLAIATENLKRPFGFDMDEPTRFGNAPTFDPQIFSTPREYVGALLEGGYRRAYTPLDVADWLEAFAQDTELAGVKAKACADFHRPAVQRLLIDAQIAAAIGRFFAEKFRGSCWGEIFVASHSEKARLKAVDHLKRAKAAWITAVDLSKDVYQDDLTFGPGHHLRGSWQSRLADIDRELKDLSTFSHRHSAQPDVDAAAGEQAIAALESRKPVGQARIGVDLPATFTRGEAITVTAGNAGGEAVLHYRHVNQGERWTSIPMEASETGSSATIPADYTDSIYHLQCYVSVHDAGRVTLAPGLDPDLANTPYYTLTQA